VAPIIESQPDSQLVSTGQIVALSVIAVGPPPLFYRWTYNGTDIASATDSTVVLTDVGTNQTGNYDVVVSNNFGSVTSSNAVLTVDVPPRIETQPQSQGVLPGANAAFSFTATGLPLNFQWLMNSSPIAGQTGSTLTLTNVSGANDGQYEVIISNAVGAVTSVPVALDIEYGTAFLDPGAFASLGTFNPSNNVVVDSSSESMFGGVSFLGLRVTNNGNNVLVFAFSKFTLNAYLTITFTNFTSNVSVALLSQGDMTIDGTINNNGGRVGGFGVGGSANNGGGGGGGGGFGGSGGAGEWGEAGGGIYNLDLTSEVGCGSAGGDGVLANAYGEGGGLGGDGGGALQLAANGLLTINGSVQVDGLAGRFASGLPGLDTGSGGGGSGGGLLIQAGDVNITKSAMIFARGGQGGPSYMFPAGGPRGAQPGGGGGGGGRIVVAYLNSGVNNGTIVATGGDGGGPLVSGVSSGNGADGTPGTIVFGRNPTIPAIPRLAASLDSLGNVILSWPISATNYVLQTSDSLTPSAVWATLGTAAPSGESIVFSNQASSVSAFFRLTGR